MKRLPLILAALFLAITLARVASFAQHELRAGWLGWVFSIGLGVAVYAASYWTRVQTTRKQAVAALVLFVLLDAYFNFAHVWLSADVSVPLVAAGAVLYGLFPTLAVALLGWLSGAISRLPPGVGERSVSRIEQAIAGRVAEWIQARTDEPVKPAELPEPEQAKHAHICTVCNPPVGFSNSKSYAGHMSAHARARRNGHEVKEKI